MTSDRISINGVYYRKETFQKRAAEIQEAIEKTAELYEVEELPDKPIKPEWICHSGKNPGWSYNRFSCV